MRSLRGRLTFAAVVFAAAVLLVGSFVVAADVGVRLNRSINDDLAHRFTDVSTAVAAGDYQVIAADPLTQVVTLDGAVIPESILPGQVALLDDTEVAAARAAPIVVDHRDIRLRAQRQGNHIVVVGTSSQSLRAVRARERLVLFALVPTLVLLAGLGAWLLVGATMRPVTAMASEAERLSVTSPGQRLPVPSGDDEIAQLARNLNGLLDHVEEALASDRAFVDDASHELRTPLGVLRGEIELAQLTLGDAIAAGGHGDTLATVQDSLRRADAEVQRLTRLAEELLTLARLDRGEASLKLRAVELIALANEVADRFGRTKPSVTVQGDTTFINADRDRLDQVLANLLVNARRHARARVLVSVATIDRGDVQIVVADDGPGFPSALVDRVFERFRRADSARRRTSVAGAGEHETGTGLGMAIVAGIVANHGGTISAANGPPYGGAVVTIVLPTERPKPRPTDRR